MNMLAVADSIRPRGIKRRAGSLVCGMIANLGWSLIKEKVVQHIKTPVQASHAVVYFNSLSPSLLSTMVAFMSKIKPRQTSLPSSDHVIPGSKELPEVGTPRPICFAKDRSSALAPGQPINSRIQASGNASFLVST